MPRTPLIADLRRNSLDDGPGIRSVVFFKGCPLRCAWCQNPETLSLLPEVQRSPERCEACERCVAACPERIPRPGSAAEDRQRCTLCGRCVDACDAGARRLVGQAMELEELTRQLLRDAPFYRRSGGGVTLSGGEPTLHARFAGALAARLRAADVEVLLETCGLFGWSTVEEHLLPHVTAVYFDLKLRDPARHQRATGHGNARILQNLRRLVDRGTELLVRTPLVPGLTDDDDNLTAVATQVRELGLGRLALLPYNPLWLSKRCGLAAGEAGLAYDRDRWMTDEEVAHCEDVVRRVGLEVAR
ncbi:MAG: glycyl-radical enzyme activating protein [bacterium]